MAYTVKDWRDYPDTTTPITAAALEDMETRLSAYSEQGPTPFVTSLPGSPVDGQEVNYLAAAAKGVAWRLKYRAAEAGSYKWYCVGGTELADEVAATEATTSTTFANLTTVGPQLTVPLAGDYDVQWGAMTGASSGSGVTMIGIAVGATAASDSETARGGGATTGQWASATRRISRTGIAAGTAIVTKYRTTAGTGTWEQRWLRVRPVRVG